MSLGHDGAELGLDLRLLWPQTVSPLIFRLAPHPSTTLYFPAGPPGPAPFLQETPLPLQNRSRADPGTVAPTYPICTLGLSFSFCKIKAGHKLKIIKTLGGCHG